MIKVKVGIAVSFPCTAGCDGMVHAVVEFGRTTGLRCDCDSCPASFTVVVARGRDVPLAKIEETYGTDVDG